MPRKIRSYGNPIKPVIQNYSEDEDKGRFVFTVDPQCIVTFPIDHSLYVCDICSSVLKTRDTFKKHYIKFHINHAHATLSDLKCCGALPINLSNFKEDEGCFRCHFCIGLFFPEKSDLKKHLNEHDILQEIDEQILDSEDLIHRQNVDIVENNSEAVTNTMKPCNQTESSEISIPLLEMKQCKEPVIITTLSDFLPLPNPNIPTASGLLNSLPESLVTLPPKCNQVEVSKEPLSSLLGLSLLTLFNTPPNLLPDTISNCVESTSSAQGGRCSSPIFAQDCTTSNPVKPVEYLSSYHTLPPGEILNNSISSTSSLGSTEDISQFTANDSSEKSEEIFSSLTTSRSDSDEEISTVDKNMVDNIDNIVLACLFCDRIFANIKSRRINWECVFCKTNFNNCDSLLNHLCSNHSDIFLTCISCKVRFDTKAFMDTHFQNKHKSENITHNENNLSELHNKDALLHQLKCIPYYTNENIYYSLSRKIKLFVFNKLSPTSKRHNMKQVTDQSVQVLKDDFPEDCETKSSQALNYIGSILKRKLTKDQSKLPTLPLNKIVKLNKDLNELAIENNYQSSLAVSPSHISPDIESIQEGVDGKNAFEYHVETDVKLEFDSIHRQMQILCLYCSKISFSVKGNNTHIARIHKMRRGGKNCSFCATNFKTLDLLFSHLCSKHINVYFACVICRERFDSKHSLLMHFDKMHDSVNINNGTENLHESSNDHKKELFMFDLKCLPSYPFKPICSTECKMCRSPSVEKVLQALAMNMTIKISNNTLPFQVEDKITNNKSKHDQTTILVNLKYPSLLGDSNNCLKSQNQIDYTLCKPNLLVDTVNGAKSKLSLIFDKPENKPIVESIDSTEKVTETNLGPSSVEDSMIRLVSTEMPNLDSEYNKCSPITSSSIETDLNILNCLFCDKTFVKAKAYRVHLYRSHKAKKNKCMFCNIEFNYYEDLFAHLLLTHSDIYIACEICKIRFNAFSALNKHEDKVHKPEQAKESNDVIDDVPILTKVIQIDEPKCVPEPIHDPPPCLEFKRDNKCPLAELGLHPTKIDRADENEKDEVVTSIRQHGHQMINFSHPKYENIAKKNYAYLDITVQLQVLTRLKDFTDGKQDSTQHPPRPLKQQKTSGKSLGVT